MYFFRTQKGNKIKDKARFEFTATNFALLLSQLWQHCNSCLEDGKKIEVQHVKKQQTIPRKLIYNCAQTQWVPHGWKRAAQLGSFFREMEKHLA